MRRAALALAIAVGLAIGTVVPASALGLTQVTLTCNDGTNVTYVVDTDTLLGLTQAVQGMIDYPAGLTCSLTSLPVLALGLTAVAASPGQNPFIVGGGRWLVPCSALPGGGGGGGIGAPVTQPPDTFFVNIAVNAHQHADGTFFGTLNETIPANQSCPKFGPVGESHFTSKPTCFTVVAATMTTPQQAFVTSLVTQTSGAPFPADASGSVTTGFNVHFGFQDNGNPSQGTDLLNGPPNTGPADTVSTCTPGNPTPDQLLVHGNITVHP